MRIDIYSCEEILITITRNKTRSLLTAFGVFWGIFMLVALIGGGQGMQQAMSSQFEGFATNSAFLVSQKTGEAYKGFRKGRWWNLELSDIERCAMGWRKLISSLLLSPMGKNGSAWR
jgi:putative ABC transport system permease protein